MWRMLLRLEEAITRKRFISLLTTLQCVSSYHCFPLCRISNLWCALVFHLIKKKKKRQHICVWKWNAPSLLRDDNYLKMLKLTSLGFGMRSPPLSYLEEGREAFGQEFLSLSWRQFANCRLPAAPPDPYLQDKDKGEMRLSHALSTPFSLSWEKYLPSILGNYFGTY